MHGRPWPLSRTRSSVFAQARDSLIPHTQWSCREAVSCVSLHLSFSRPQQISSADRSGLTDIITSFFSLWNQGHFLSQGRHVRSAYHEPCHSNTTKFKGLSVFLSSRAELSRTSRGSSSATLPRKDNCGQLYSC